MESVVGIAKTAWRSENLIYKAVDDKDEKLVNLVHEHLSNDPVVQTLSLSDLIKPSTKKQSAEYIEKLTKCLLAVAIYLPGRAGPQASVEHDTKSPDKPKPEDTSEVVGYICLSPMPPSMTHHRFANIAVCLSGEHQNRGYGSEAINWIVDWGFRHANLHRIGIGAVSFNTRAVRLYQKLGFTVEGRQRERILWDRKWYDIVDMSMLEHEWEALRAPK
ncbi:hypothetical protein QQS21_003079 [Conoideocrella luteorostrata]|uniref:N-acetyltransferase domain-containing protein n=1 Tax=Conoideocrella luteorostrata TaxID=1105319 RepID=A0AAJ0CUW1_9HYPO|nr:hypothetical protein QQS21_003079 [Conoideocrella luteorostrata]